MPSQVVESIINVTGDHCVDIFIREDGSFGFEEFRRDHEDLRGWFSLHRYHARSFASQDDALRQAGLSVAWMAERLTRPTLRRGTAGDATSIGVLSIQVFLDTYATDGVRPDIAREALSQYLPERFEQRLVDKDRAFIVAEQGEGLVGFAEVCTRARPAPVPGAHDGFELARLYVQPASQRAGLGRKLLSESEIICVEAGCDVIWLTAWSGNARALDFYSALGYSDIGSTSYTFEGNAYENRVLLKQLSARHEPR